jgi:hypothetical protein
MEYTIGMWSWFHVEERLYQNCSTIKALNLSLEDRKHVASRFADVLDRDNPNFNYPKFWTACTGEVL